MKKVVNLQEIEEKYGTEIAKEIKRNIERASEQNDEWKLEVIRDSEYFITFVFAIGYCSTVYEVVKSSNKIMDQFIIGKLDCEKILALMYSFEQKKKQQALGSSLQENQY